MRLFISGRPKRIPLKAVKQAAKFFIEKLISARLRQGLIIKVQFVPHFYKLTRCWGDCGPEYIEPRPKKFLIRIDSSQSARTILKTLAHELAHVKSYACGDLRSYQRTDKLGWKGKLFSSDFSDETYWLSPWEIEAHGYELCLYELFQVYKKRAKL